jgi:hypothetical protein
MTIADEVDSQLSQAMDSHMEESLLEATSLLAGQLRITLHFGMLSSCSKDTTTNNSERDI